MIDTTDCHMRRKDTKGNYYCMGYNYNECPIDCKFYKSREMQLLEERKILTRIRTKKPYLFHDFCSVVNSGVVYVDAEKHNSNIIKERNTND